MSDRETIRRQIESLCRNHPEGVHRLQILGRLPMANFQDIDELHNEGRIAKLGGAPVLFVVPPLIGEDIPTAEEADANEHRNLSWNIEWADGKREPQSRPDPKYPEGKDVVAVKNQEAPTCTADLPYPVKRCGLFMVECRACGFNAAITTAGRPDDPRSLTVNCLPSRN